MPYTHVFAVCAYGESPYLEACLRSLKAQTMPSEIIICTSTPSNFLEQMGEKYGVSVYVRQWESNIRDDRNFAWEKADGEFVTLAHQDDVYHRTYGERLKKAVLAWPDMTVFTSDYVIVKGDRLISWDKLLLVKRILRMPLRLKCASHLSQVKKLSLMLGNSICCPACTYHKEMLGAPLFHSSCRFALDWDTLIDLAMRPGRFICVEEPLVFHRLHKDAATNACMKDSRRYEEERAMFRRLWPKPAAEFLMGFYKKAYTSCEEDGTEKKNGK